MSAQVNGKRMAGGVISVLLLFLLVGVGKTIVEDPPAGGDPTTTVPSNCGQRSAAHYYRHDLPENVNHFGPSVKANDVKAALGELHARRCVDPALTVAHRQYSLRQYTSPGERLSQTSVLSGDQKAWALNVLALESREKTARRIEIVDMTERYNTLYMVDTSIPYIYQNSVDRPLYRVLRFTYADGTVDNYKLDCGFQPVEPVFEGVPGPPPGKATPSGPTPTVAPKPGPTPTTCDPRVCKGPDRNPAPCRTSDGIDCGGPGAGGQPGTGGASNHGSDGYSPQDPAPPPIVTTVKPPSSTTMLPPTTAPPTTVVPKPIG